MNHDHSQHDVRPKAFWGSRYSVGLLVLGAIALYFLLTEHRAHFFLAMPQLQAGQQEGRLRCPHVRRARGA